jgi:hypothetical protein
MVAFALVVQAAQAVPFGYRYVGSRVVSEGRVVYWYWNVDRVEVAPNQTSFVAHMFARAVDVNQERPFVAIVRCDSRTYKGIDSRGPYEAIDAGEPIDAVWRAGCENGRAVSAGTRYARLGSGATPMPSTAAAAPATDPRPGPAAVVPTPSPSAEPAAPRVARSAAASPAAHAVSAASAAPRTTAEPAPQPRKEDAGDPRRADRCVRFALVKGVPAGDATITNTCVFPIEITVCYKGRAGGIYDCPSPAKGRHADSLGPGVTHVLPEYQHGRHGGIASVACKGTMGSVFPRLDDTGGGCR